MCVYDVCMYICTYRYKISTHDAYWNCLRYTNPSPRVETTFLSASLVHMHANALLIMKGQLCLFTCTQMRYL